MSKKISIIIPVYNQEEFLKECLESVINQTYKEIEIVIINDGSSDNSWNIIKNYSNKDNRIIAINQKNQGVYKTRCVGIKKATGDYIMFLDSDDFLNTKCIEKMYQYINSGNVDIVRCNFNFYKKNKTILHESKLKEGIYYKDDYENKLYEYIFNTLDLNSVCMQVVKKAILKDIVNIDYNLKFGEDLIFNSLIINNSDSICILNEPLYNYRVNPNSFSRSISSQVITDRINDIFKYTNILDSFINTWNIKDKKRFKKYLYQTMLKNLIYQLIKSDKKSNYNLYINHIYSNRIFEKNAEKINYEHNIKTNIMIFMERLLVNKKANTLYICTRLMKIIIK